MRPFEGVVALACRGPVEFPDPGGVEIRRINGDLSIGKESVQGKQALFHQIPGGLVVGDVHAVEQVGAVARVGPDRVRESHLYKPTGHLLGPFKSGLVLLLGGGNPARPDRVQVHRKPPAAEDIRVGGSGVFPVEPEFHPVGPPGEEGRVDRVQGEVDPLHLGESVQGGGMRCQGLGPVEVPGVDRIVRECPELGDALVGEEQGEGLGDLLTHRFLPAHPGQGGRAVRIPRLPGPPAGNSPPG